jgi:PAS domain S-box-containing protein
MGKAKTSQNPGAQLSRTLTALEEDLALYTELFEFAPIGYATVAPDGTFLEVNYAASAVLGKARSELVGRSLLGLIAERDQPRVEALLSAILVGSPDQRLMCEAELIQPAGCKRQLQFTAACGARRTARILLAIEDTTERDERLRLAEQALREAEQRKEELLIALSHELRNPLTPIRSSLFVLSKVDPTSPRADRAHQIIDRQVTQLTRLVDGLLDVTRIAGGKIELERQHLDLAELVHCALDDHRSSFDANGVSLEECFERGSFSVHADPVRVTQSVSNLLSNALRFTPRNGRVTVYLERDDTHVRMRVKDTGVGISADMQRYVFEPFAQAPQALDRTRGGLGLGLTLVKGLIEMHGGDVSVMSPGVGLGTEVMLTLPLDPGPPPPESEGAPPLRARRVLVIEDNPDTSEMLKEALALNGHEVQLAGDGPGGLELAQSFHPEVVICDLGLPGMDGYGVARAIRSSEILREVYLVALSGYARPADRQRTAEAGFDVHVAKPSSLTHLARLVSEAPRSVSSHQL